jgi:ABC-type polysaccharide/polyol phosphate transport system ATPase subunit
VPEDTVKSDKGSVLTRPVGLVVGPPPMNAIVEMVGVTKRYRRGGRGRLALDELDLVVPSGGVFGVLGRNGAGKTTALRCLLGLIRPTSGLSAGCSGWTAARICIA